MAKNSSSKFFADENLKSELKKTDAIFAQNIFFSYNEKSILKNISFKISRGDYVAILGENGSGKSTLAKIIFGFLSPQSGKIFTHQNDKIGIVFQDPKFQIISGIVSRDVAFGPENLLLSNAEVEQRVIENLGATGLLFKAFSPTNELSLGQTQKLAIAGILALNPEILIFDEATSMLDFESRAEILKILGECNSRGCTILHITHENSEAKCAKKILKLKNGKIDFFDDEKKFVFESDDLIELKSEEKFEREDFFGEEIFRAKDLSYSYNGEKNVFEKINFSLYRGTLNAITGASGEGKSTLLEMISGLLTPKEGKIFCAKKPVLALQENNAALFEKFVADDVAFGPKNQGVKKSDLILRVKNAMANAGIPYEVFGERQTAFLSGGEKRKVALAAILAMDADIFLFDEPTLGMDLKSRKEILYILKRLTHFGKTVFFSTHKIDEAEFADVHFKIQNGKLSILKGKDFFKNEKSKSLPLQTPYSGAKLLERLSNFGSALNSSGEKNLLQNRFSKISKAQKNQDEKNFSKQSQKLPLIFKLPPILKYCIFFAIFFAAILVKKIFLSTVIFGITFIYAALSHYPFKKIFFGFLKIFPFLILLCMIQFYFQRNFKDCVRIILQSFCVLNCVCVFIFSSGEKDLLEGFSAILKPLTILKIPVRPAVVVLEITLRFFPLLVDEARSILKTQLVRGALGKSKGFFSKLKVMIPLFIPLFLQTIKRAESLACALCARYF